MKSTLPGLEKANEALAKKGIPPIPVKEAVKETKEDRKLKKLCGLTTDFQVGTRKIELHPVLVKNWVDFSKCLFILENPTLHEIFMFDDGPDFLWDALKIVCRVGEVPELFYEMTQADYARLRANILEQNDVDFEEVYEKRRKKIQDLLSQQGSPLQKG